MRSMTINQLPPLDYFSEEAIDRLRVNVGFMGEDKKVLLITSSVPGEGKSFVSVNLWRELALAGKRVALVDADMRKSMLRSELRLTADGEFLGLSHYLSGQASVTDVLYATNVKGGYMIPTVTMINPSLLLEGSRFQGLMEALRDKFDYVIVDTPPLGVVSDGQMIANQCDGCLLVVRAHSTGRGLVKDSVQQMEHVNCPLLGVVLNRVEEKKSTYYHSGGHEKYYYSNTAKEKPAKRSAH